MSQTETDITIPPKRNDEETLAERMTDNGYNKILPSRYLEKDENGEIIEEQEELFERVAKNIALGEIPYCDTRVDVKKEKFRDEFKDRFPEDKEMVPLDEENVKYVSYDAIIDRLPDDVSDAVRARREEFEEAMSHLRFMPNTPTLINAGSELQQLSACFVDSPGDDMEDIHETAKEASLVFQSGGGMGYAFHHLRPYGDTVGSTGGIASGPITFMQTYDQMCQTIAQGGARRGAQMGIMKVTHPDVIQFIHAKNKDVSLAETLRLNDPKDYRNTSFKEALEEARELINEDGRVESHLRNAAEGNLANFNISVGVTDEFMRCVEEDEEFTFINPRTDEPHISTEQTKEMYSWFDLGEHVEVGEPLSVPAREIWEDLIEGANENGEPGVFFIDRANKQHSFDVEKHPEYEIHATNPCGEQPLMEYEACNLGHINLSTVVDEDRTLWDDFTEGREADRFEEEVGMFLDQAIDREELNHRIDLGTRFLENVVTMSDFPIEEIEQTVANNRKIGLGIMGLASMYVQLGVEYGSVEADEIARQVMEHIDHKSKSASHSLAVERGSFGNWEDSKYAYPTEYPEWFEKATGENPEDWSETGYPIRNHNTTTIAPTGTTSMIANTSGGCEPIHNVIYQKNVSQDVQGEERLVEMDDYFRRVLEANDIDPEAVRKEAVQQMSENEFAGTDSLSTVPDEIGDLFISSGELSARDHASVQCALQEGVDSAISKTVNAPSHFDTEDAREVFEYVYENGGKGVTYYRAGSRAKEVIMENDDTWEGSDEQEEEEAESESPEAPSPRSRPDVTHGSTMKIDTGYGGLYVTINEDEQGLFEVFATVGKSGGFTESMVESTARLASLSLRSGVEVDEVIEQLEGIRSPKTNWDNGDTVHSIPDGIALALKRYRGDDVIEDIADQIDDSQDNDSSRNDARDIVNNGTSPECPECGAMKVMSEGCEECEECGWSAC